MSATISVTVTTYSRSGSMAVAAGTMNSYYLVCASGFARAHSRRRDLGGGVERQRLNDGLHLSRLSLGSPQAVGRPATPTAARGVHARPVARLHCRARVGSATV